MHTKTYAHLPSQVRMAFMSHWLYGSVRKNHEA